MKKIILILAIFIAPLAYTMDGPFVGVFNIKTSNAAGVVEATDQLVKDCGMPDGVTATLSATALNGTDESTHSYLMTYENNAAYVAWNQQIATCSGWSKYGATMSEISEQVAQALMFPLTGGGDPSADNVYVSFFVDVEIDGLAKFFNAYEELMAENSTNGSCPGSWGLFQFGPGSVPDEFGTHLAFCGYSDLGTAMAQVQERPPSKAFQKFLRKTYKKADTKAVTMGFTVKRYQ